MLKASVAMIAACCVAMPAKADVCQLNSKPIADKAVALLTGVGELIVYCGSCSNQKAFAIPLVKAQAVATDDPNYFEVKLDGTATDLANIYHFPAPGARRWINVGFSAGCADAQSVALVELPSEMSDSAAPPQSLSNRCVLKMRSNNCWVM